MQRSITMNGYKLIYYPKANNMIRLYKVSEDPHETNDLMKSNHPSLKEVVASLWDRLNTIQGEFGDTLKLERSE